MRAYRGKIKNEHDTYTVLIAPPGNVTDVVDVPLAADGVVITYEGSVSDPLKPVMLSGCSVSLLLDPNDNAEHLTAGDINSTGIVTVRGETSGLIWQGRVTPNTYDQVWEVKRRVLTLECVDNLSLLKYVPFAPTTQATLLSVTDYLSAALSAAGGNLSLAVSEPFTGILLSQIGINRSNWVDEGGNDAMWLEVIEDIARALKLRVVQTGAVVHVGDVEAIQDDWQQFDNLTLLAQPKLSLQDTYNKVSVTVSVKTGDSALPKIFDESRLTALETDYYAVNLEDGRYSVPYIRVSSDCCACKFYRPTSPTTAEDSAGAPGSQPWFPYMGAFLVRQGSKREYPLRADNQLIGGGVSFKDTIVLSTCGESGTYAEATKTGYLRAGLELFKVKDTREHIFARSTRLVLHGSVKVLGYLEPCIDGTADVDRDVADHLFALQTDMRLTYSLRIGDKWYCYSSLRDGSTMGDNPLTATRWSTTETRLPLYIAPDTDERYHERITYGDCAAGLIIRNEIDWKTGISIKGTCIYIEPSDMVSGDIELTIYSSPIMETKANRGDHDSDIKYWVLSDLGLDIGIPDGWMATETDKLGDTDIEYSNLISDANVAEFDEVSLKCHTDVGHAYAESALLDTSSGLAYLGDVTDARRGETGIIEQHLVDALYRQYRANRALISGTALHSMMSPLKGYASSRRGRVLVPVQLAWHLDGGKTLFKLVETDTDYQQE